MGDATCPVRANSVVRPIMPVSRAVAWRSWISDEATRVGRRPAGVWPAQKILRIFEEGRATLALKEKGAHVGSRPFPIDSLFDRGCEPVLQAQPAEQIQQQHDEKNGTEDAHASARAPA